jgi:hypothetical protein
VEYNHAIIKPSLKKDPSDAFDLPPSNSTHVKTSDQSLSLPWILVLIAIGICLAIAFVRPKYFLFIKRQLETMSWCDQPGYSYRWNTKDFNSLLLLFFDFFGYSRLLALPGIGERCAKTKGVLIDFLRAIRKNGNYPCREKLMKMIAMVG